MWFDLQENTRLAPRRRAAAVRAAARSPRRRPPSPVRSVRSARAAPRPWLGGLRRGPGGRYVTCYRCAVRHGRFPPSARSWWKSSLVRHLSAFGDRGPGLRRVGSSSPAPAARRSGYTQRPRSFLLPLGAVVVRPAGRGQGLARHGRAAQQSAAQADERLALGCPADAPRPPGAQTVLARERAGRERVRGQVSDQFDLGRGGHRVRVVVAAALMQPGPHRCAPGCNEELQAMDLDIAGSAGSGHRGEKPVCRGRKRMHMVTSWASKRITGAGAARSHQPAAAFHGSGVVPTPFAGPCCSAGQVHPEADRVQARGRCVNMRPAGVPHVRLAANALAIQHLPGNRRCSSSPRSVVRVDLTEAFSYDVVPRLVADGDADVASISGLSCSGRVVAAPSLDRVALVKARRASAGGARATAAAGRCAGV